MRDLAAESLAGSAITMALLDFLVENSVIGRPDVLTILSRAQSSLVGAGVEAGNAAAVVGELYAKHNF